MEINVEIEKKFAGCFKAGWLRNLVEQTLISQKIGADAEVSLVVTGQRRIHELNKAYLHEDRPTDVLSFGMKEKSDKTGFVNAPDGITHLGEVIISFPQAVLQADEHGHTVEREMTILVVHGLLHLLGYDHTGAAEKRVMWDKQKEVVSLFEKAAA